MDHTGDVVELLVEHATDFRMCDLFDENLPPGNSGGNDRGPRRSGDGPIGLGLIAGKFKLCPIVLKKRMYKDETPYFCIPMCQYIYIYI